MEESSQNTQSSHQTVVVRAYSLDAHPILVLELDSGMLRVVYHETGYDLELSKSVGEEWLRDNAIGRHSFVEVSPPRRMPADDLGNYVASELGI